MAQFVCILRRDPQKLAGVSNSELQLGLQALDRLLHVAGGSGFCGGLLTDRGLIGPHLGDAAGTVRGSVAGYSIMSGR